MAGFYNTAKKGFLTGLHDWDTGTFKVILVTSAYTFNPDHEFVSSASASELTGAGYAAGYGGAGRKTITGAAVNVDNGADRAYLDCDDPSWTAINAGTAAAAILVRETGGSDATALLIAYLDLTAAQPTVGNDLVVTIPSSGWGYI